jgi:hypothetical protein
MATKTTARTTARTTATPLILATFALVGLLTIGAVAVPSPAFAQTVDENDNSDSLSTPTDFLGDLLGLDNGNGSTDEETETEETTQSGDQSETNAQSNDIDQEQTSGISNEIGSGEGSSVSSGAGSDSESTYKTKYKSSDGSSGSSIPGTSTSDSIATSDVYGNGTIGGNQELNNAAQVNSNGFGGDESRAAVVGLDFEFEESVEEEQQLPPVENGGTDGAILDQLL